MNKDEDNRLMEIMAGIFLRCFLLSFAFLLFWFILYTVAGDWIYYLHTRWFEIGKSAFDTIHYCGMAFMKISAILFFLFPYVAITLVLRKQMKVG